MGIAALLALKIIGVGGVGASVGSMLKLFHAYEWKTNKKKEVSENGKSESLRERSASFRQL